MIWLSALLVFGTLAVILRGMGAQDGELRLGFEQLIHARVPWLLLGLLWAGGGLGIASVVRKRAWTKFALLALELPLVGLVSWYILAFGYLPPHELATRVGDVFPAYALLDHEGELEEVGASTRREPTLYIFYRGDW